MAFNREGNMAAGNEGMSRRRFLELAGATGATVTLAGGSADC